MWKRKLCLATSRQFGISIEEQLRLFRSTGFEAFFTGWEPGCDLQPVVALARELGLEYQSVHAPFGQVDKVWKEGPAGDEVIAELERCVDDTARAGAPIMVSHAFIGFQEHSPTQLGVDRFARLVRHAEERGVTVAFENTEGEEYLAALMDAFRGAANVGFCWDTGHEMCYNHSQDLLARWGDRLVCTHLNDNLGIRDLAGEITFIDDLHLLPFDGIADWDGVAARLARCGYDGVLTFELNTVSKPGRHENDAYGRMPIEEYITECYKRACRVAALCARAETGKKQA